MKTRVFILIALLSASFPLIKLRGQEHKQVQENPLNTLIRPFLDSLRVVFPLEAADTTTFRFESFFPASRVNDNRFDDYNLEGSFSNYTPENPRLTGLLSDTVSLFAGCRLSISYKLTDENYTQERVIEKNYRFTSKAETSASSEKMIRQTLYLSALPKRPEGGFIEITIFDGKEDKPVDIGKPVYRNMNVYPTGQSQKYANYLLKDADETYSPIKFEEGSDRTFPSFKGGSVGFFMFCNKYMKYPPQALKEKRSGIIILQATITEKGEVKDISVQTGDDPDFIKEAIRLAKMSSGKWIPATHNGINIADTRDIVVQFNPEYAPAW
jgi:hypothetical protein